MNNNADYYEAQRSVDAQVVKKSYGLMYLMVDGSIGFLSYNKRLGMKQLFNRTGAVRATQYHLVDDIHEMYEIINYSLLPNGELSKHREVVRLG